MDTKKVYQKPGVKVININCGSFLVGSNPGAPGANTDPMGGEE